jgi:hypothetical protein
VSNFIRQILRLDTLLFKFHSTADEVSKVPATSGGGGVVRTDEPTSLFSLCAAGNTTSSPYSLPMPRTRPLCAVCAVNERPLLDITLARAGRSHHTASLESTPQLASFAPFPPACETPVHHFPVLLVLAYLNTLGLLACWFDCRDCGQSATWTRAERHTLLR